MYLVHRAKFVHANVSEASLIFFLFLCLTVMFDCAEAAELDFDVIAWSNADDPTFLETVHVEAGTTLSISAAVDDQWRLWAVDNPYWPLSKTINADGYPGMEIDGLLLGSLVGKVGESGDLFFIGTEFHEEIIETGTLYLACWDYPGMYGDNDGSIRVNIGASDGFHPADFDHDNDVDGADLAAYISDPAALELSEFVLAFGTFENMGNANLSGLAVSAGTLIPSFSLERTHYIIKVDNSTEEVSVTPELEDTLASLKINDAEATSSVPFPVSLETGGNFISIEVTSQDGSMVKDYSIIAVRTGRATLSALTLTSYDLNPDFSPDIDVYDINVEEGVDSVEILAETDDPTSLITINGVEISSGSAQLFPLVVGNNEIEIKVTATDGSSKIYYVFVRKTPTAADTVYVVDDAHAPDQFETLTGAVNHLNGSLASGQVGEIRIQTTAPMEVDALTITGDMFIIVEPGASNVISGPSGMPLVINALGGWNISGLSFANSPGYTINAYRSLSILGSSFSGDTDINISGSSGLNTSADGSYSKGFEFERGNLKGWLNVKLSGYADCDFKTVGTNAVGISFDASGALVGNAGLIYKSNPVSDLNVKATLKGNAKADISGHGGLNFCKTGFTLEEDASVFFKNNLAGSLEAEFNGFKGQVNFKNVTTADAILDVNMEESTFIGNANTYSNWSMDVGYTGNLTSFGFTEKGGYAFKKFQLNAEDAPTNAQLVIGFEDMDFLGNLNLFAGGQAKVTMNNGTVLMGEALVKLPGSIGNMDLDDIEGQAAIKVLLPDKDTLFYLKAEKSKIKQMFIDNATDKVNGDIHDVKVEAGVIIKHGIGEIPTPDAEGMQSLTSQNGFEVSAENELVFDNVEIKATENPGLYIEGVSVPVTIKNSTIDGGIWAISCANIDADVTIENNSNLTGGIRLDGDPDMAGTMIDRQYTVSNNTITQNSAGGSCISSHAIRNITASNNTMTAGPGAHGILLNGGKMLVDGGSIATCGPAGGCTAIGLGSSAGGANAVLYADNVNPITGLIIPGPQGYVKLTNNTFSNALVVDLRENARLLNDPVSDNSGLDPDGDVLGSLIDWNDDPHNCPDYPTRCDEWDEDPGQCGCGDDGIDPPSEPGI